MRKTTSRGRMLGLIAAVVGGVALSVAVVYWGSGGGGEASGDYTPINRQLSLVARDVMRSVAEWQESIGATGAGGGEGGGDGGEGEGTVGAGPLGPGGPVEFMVLLRERGVDDLPDDLGIVVCPDLRAWWDVNNARNFVPLVAARSASVLGNDVVLYDGQAVTVVSASSAPAWLASGAVWTKPDLAGSEKPLTLTR